MLEIKCRGRALRSKLWVKGYYWTNENGNHFIRQTVDLNGYFRIADIEVDLETVGRYTGLKDRNKKEIYEGDILEWNYRGINKAVVFWDSIKAGFFITPIHRYKWRIEQPSYIRAEFVNAKNKMVIGNIYENSNLLED